MKSKKSCFNLTIFKKNIGKCWPVWSLYLLILLIAGPILMGLGFQRAERYYANPVGSKFNFMSIGLQPMVILWVIFFFALLVALVVFHYLNNSRSANMMHAFPVDRNELFVTNVLSGLFMLIAPVLITFVLDLTICLTFHMPGLINVLYWALYAIGIAFILYSFAVFCVFLAGHSLAVIFYYFLLHFLYALVHFLMSLLISLFGFGLNVSDIVQEGDFWICLSPMLFLTQNLGISYHYSVEHRETYMDGFALVGGAEIACFLIVAVVFYFLSWRMYRRRKIELAGDMVAIPFVRPVMRWLIGFVTGTLLGYLGYYFFRIAGVNIKKTGLLVLILIIGFVGYMITQMLIVKSFKVFKKAFWLEGLAFLATLMIVFTGSYFSAKLIEKRSPRMEDIQYATIDLNYQVRLEGKDIEQINDIMKQIIDNRSRIERDPYDESEQGMNSVYIYINYHMKDGSDQDRNYSIYINEASKPIIDRINALEWEPDHFLTSVFGEPGLPESRVKSVFYEKYSTYEVNGDTYSESIAPEITDPNYSKDLYKAIIADTKEHNLQPYNGLVGICASPEYAFDGKYYVDDLALYLYISKEEHDEYGWGYTDDGNTYFSQYYISFGPRCKNILNVLKEYGAITSEDELIFVNYEDYIFE